jgi:hypothetical protein
MFKMLYLSLRGEHKFQSYLESRRDAVCRRLTSYVEERYIVYCGRLLNLLGQWAPKVYSVMDT